MLTPHKMPGQKHTTAVGVWGWLLLLKAAVTLRGRRYHNPCYFPCHAATLLLLLLLLLVQALLLLLTCAEVYSLLPLNTKHLLHSL
jgi:hypothetical protein